MTYYKPYPNYKDSMVEWLGQVPTHWTVSRLRFAAELNPSIKKEILENLEAEVSFLPMETIGETGSLNLEQTRSVNSVRNGYSYFENGDIAFAKVTPCFENGKGAMFQNLIGNVGFGTTELTVLRPKARTDARFLNFVIRSERFRSFGVGAMTGAGGLKRVPDEFTRNFIIAWPGYLEQAAIATHLNKEISLIDELIKKKNVFCYLLREKRLTLIKNLITRGTSPKTKAKNSNLEWLGLIPDHWEVTPVKRVIDFIEQGWSPECEARPSEKNEWAILKVGCVNGGSFRASENKALPNYLEPRPELSLKKGDILVSRANTRELVGGCAVISQDFPRLMICDKLYRLKPNSKIISDYLAAIIAILGRREVEVEATGASSSMVNISQSVILNLKFALPPIDEQLQIMSAITTETNKLDTLITKTELSLKLLKERRTALITAAVTGQIDLREAP